MRPVSSTDQEILAAYRDTGSMKAAARACAAGVNRVRRLVRLLPPTVGSSPAPARPTPEFLPKRIPAKAFLAELDLPGKVRDALKKLGGDAVLDNDLRIALNIPSQQWSAIRDLPEFKDNQVEHKGRRYWASKELIGAAHERKNAV